MLGLSALALRRVLPLWLLAGLALLLFLAARDSGDAPLVPPDEGALASLHALARQNVWSVLLVSAPFLFQRAAQLGGAASNAWLAPTPAPRLAAGLALALGCALASTLVTGLTALASEAACAEAPRAWRRTRVGPNPSALLVDGAASVRWSVPAPELDESHGLPGGLRLRLWTTVAIGSGPAVGARFRAAAGGRTSACEARIAGRTALELTPPAPERGILELELERLGSGALLVLPAEALEFLVPAASERLTAVVLGTRVLLALATGCALALGLGRVLRPALAAWLVLALFFLAGTSDWAAEWIPGSDLPRAWGELTGGLVPAGVPPSALLGTLVLAALGLGLYAWGSPERRP